MDPTAHPNAKKIYYCLEHECQLDHTEEAAAHAIDHPERVIDGASLVKRAADLERQLIERRSRVYILVPRDDTTRVFSDPIILVDYARKRYGQIRLYALDGIQIESLAHFAGDELVIRETPSNSVIAPLGRLVGSVKVLSRGLR
jgi:hypothetical protein